MPGAASPVRHPRQQRSAAAGGGTYHALRSPPMELQPRRRVSGPRARSRSTSPAQDPSGPAHAYDVVRKLQVRSCLHQASHPAFVPVIAASRHACMHARREWHVPCFAHATSPERQPPSRVAPLLCVRLGLRVRCRAPREPSTPLRPWPLACRRRRAACCWRRRPRGQQGATWVGSRAGLPTRCSSRWQVPASAACGMSSATASWEPCCHQQLPIRRAASSTSSSPAGVATARQAEQHAEARRRHCSCGWHRRPRPPRRSLLLRQRRRPPPAPEAAPAGVARAVRLECHPPRPQAETPPPATTTTTAGRPRPPRTLLTHPKAAATALTHGAAAALQAASTAASAPAMREWRPRARLCAPLQRALGRRRRRLLLGAALRPQPQWPRGAPRRNLLPSAA